MYGREVCPPPRSSRAQTKARGARKRGRIGPKLTPPARRKKPSDGSTAMRHAVAWAESHFGTAAVLRAGKKIAWISRGGKLTPISRGEDLFSCGDLLCLRPGRPLLAQVTTQTKSGGGVWNRRRKVEAWIRQLGPYRADAQVMSWVRGKHFRVWIWHHGEEQWLEADTVWSPKQTREWDEHRRSQADTGGG
jgi:hypothetical protein